MSAVSVFGLGYVGCVSAACFAREGHAVWGVDISDQKVAAINAGLSTIVEEGIGELVHEQQAAGRLRATKSVVEAINATSISLICVGTPSRPNGSIELKFVERVCEEIGEALRHKSEFHLITIRSTVLPGTIQDVVIPAIQRTSGKQHGVGFGVCSNPEFLREGTSIKDFYDPPYTLIGALDPAHADILKQLYTGINAPVHVVALRVAEMVKYACNCFHGLKVGFANEIGNVCKALQVDSHEVMRLFCEDRKLNISAAYLKPGFAFGGSCLPKDLRAIVHRARVADIELPILDALLESNKKQIARAFEMVTAAGSRQVGVLGLAFKAGTDDLRESPMVSLIEQLIGRGFQVSIYDRDVSQANLVGANREYIEREIPHIWSLVTDNVDTLLARSETIVIGNRTREVEKMSEAFGGRMVIDLARAFEPSAAPSRYEGLCW